MSVCVCMCKVCVCEVCEGCEVYEVCVCEREVWACVQTVFCYLKNILVR